MPIYQIDEKGITPLERTTFAEQNLRERRDLQSLLKDHIEVISPDTLIVAEEFGDWEESRRRIDLLGLDEVRIVLASGEFSKELTTSVMWLNEYGLDIRCVRMQPYAREGRILMDVQTVIPVPEASDYQVRIREKKQEERESRKNARGGGYDFSVAGERYKARSNRQFMFLLVSAILNNGGTPRQISEAVPWRPDMLVRLERSAGGDEQALHFDDKTYVLNKRWGPRTLEAADSLARTFPDLNIEISQVPRKAGGARFDLLVAGERYAAQTRPEIMLRVVAAILSKGGTPRQVREALPWRRQLFEELEGTLGAEQVQLPPHRFFCGEGEVFHSEGRTYVLSNQWKGLRAPNDLAEAFPELNIHIEPAAEERAEGAP